MRDILYNTVLRLWNALCDIRANALLVLLKIAVFVLLSVAVYNMVTLGESADDAARGTIYRQQTYELYELYDTYLDPDEYYAFMNDEARVATMAEFDSALERDGVITFLPMFDQAVYVYDFVGEERFGYGFGWSTTSDEGVSPEGRPWFRAKSLQLSQATYDFFGLSISEGSAPDWDAVDYASGRIPVLLGNEYRGVYNLGDTIEGCFYVSDLSFEVVGFISPASALWYKSNPDFKLDEYVVIPYPPVLEPERIGDPVTYRTIVSAMLCSAIAVPTDLSTAQALDRLDAIASRTGFYDYTMLNVSDWQVQLRFMRTLMESSFWLVTSLAALITVIGLGVVAFLDVALARRRATGVRVRMLLGDDLRTAVRSYGTSMFVEHVSAAAVAGGIAWALPNGSGAAARNLLLAFAVVALADSAWQRWLMRRTARAEG